MAGSADAGENRWLSTADVREVYADQAGRMALFAGVNRLVTGGYRGRLFERAQGRVLDVACGLGMNRRYLPPSVEYVGVDLSPEMLAEARRRRHWQVGSETFLEMDAQSLGFCDDAFDTVVSSLSTCTFPDPAVALEEMARVCDPDGRILLLEHGRSSVGMIARLQDWRAPAHYEKHACRLNQEPLELVEAAGLSVEDVETGLFGILTAIEARPV